MFQSARSSVQHNNENKDDQPTTSRYSSYAALERERCDKDKNTDDVVVLSDSDVDEEAVQFINSFFQKQHSSHRKSKKEKKVKKEKHRKHHKSRKRERSSSSSDDVVVVKRVRAPEITGEFNADNYEFSKALKKHPLHPLRGLPLSKRFDMKTLDLLFGSSNYDADKRYFGSKMVKTLQRNRPAKERRFRRRHFESISGFIPLSENPMDTDEELKTLLEEGYEKDMDTEVYSAWRKEKLSGIEHLTYQEKKTLVQADLKERPNDPKVWQRFLNVEEEYTRERVVLEGGNAEGLRHVHLERRIDILKDAIAKVGKGDKIPFIVDRLKSMVELYGSTSKELKTAYANALEIWEFSIEQHLGAMILFKVSKTIRSINDAVDRLWAIESGVFLSHKPVEGTEDFVFELLANRIRLYIESGHHNKAVATVQAAIEFTCFMPERFKNLPLTAQHKEFEKFWSSSVPRVGDVGAQGWCNYKFPLAASESAKWEALEMEKLMEEDTYCISRTHDLSTQRSTSTTLATIWCELESLRSSTKWRPVRRLIEDDEFEFNERYVGFDVVKPSLIYPKDPQSREKLAFKLLSCLGVIDPVCPDTSQRGIFMRVLPDLYRTYTENLYNYTSFLVDILRQLLNVRVFDKVRTLCAIVRTTHEGMLQTVTTSPVHEIRLLHDSLPRTSDVETHMAFLEMLAVVADLSGMPAEAAGTNLNDLDDGDRRKEKEHVVKGLLQYCNTDPCTMAPSSQKQIILHAAVQLCQRLPSSHSKKAKTGLNRLRFLVCLVLKDKMKGFLDLKQVITPKDIEEARRIWIEHFGKFDFDDPPTRGKDDHIVFVDTSAEAIYKLARQFVFEVTGENPFPDMTALDSCKDRVVFHIDFIAELVNIHRAQFSEYANLVERVFFHRPKDVRLYPHLIRILQAKSCHFLNSQRTRQHAIRSFCQIAAIFKNFLHLRDTDATETVAKGMENLLRKNLETFTENNLFGIEPTSLLPRFWMGIERASGHYAKAEEVYLRSLRRCPYSKNLILDAARNPNATEGHISDIYNYSVETEIKIHTLPAEAEILFNSMNNPL